MAETKHHVMLHLGSGRVTLYGTQTVEQDRGGQSISGSIMTWRTCIFFGAANIASPGENFLEHGPVSDF